MLAYTRTQNDNEDNNLLKYGVCMGIFFVHVLLQLQYHSSCCSCTVHSRKCPAGSKKVLQDFFPCSIPNSKTSTLNTTNYASFLVKAVGHNIHRPHIYTSIYIIHRYRSHKMIFESDNWQVLCDYYIIYKIRYKIQDRALLNAHRRCVAKHWSNLFCQS